MSDERGATTDSGQLLDEGLATTLRQRWQELQTRFVDDPQDSVRSADALVEEAMHGVTRRIAEEKGRLEEQWSAGGETGTEELRRTLQQYRAVLDRLLAS
jgi:hypothetical protein